MAVVVEGDKAPRVPSFLSLPKRPRSPQARLATNCVTMGDMTRPARINTFVNDLHNGFRLLNLKNDNLRKKCVPKRLVCSFP